MFLPNNQWIDVSKELPPMGRPVLAVAKKYGDGTTGSALRCVEEMRKTGYGPSVMESSMTQAISPMKVNTTSPTGCPYPNCQKGAKHEREIRTKPRQTTPLEDIPESAVITRVGHSFEGQRLQIIRRQLRAGRPHLLLLLPDQSRGLIPVDWTDYTDAVSARTVPPIGALGSLADL